MASQQWKAGAAVLLIVGFLQFMFLSRVPSEKTDTIVPRNSTASGVQMSSNTISLSPGELPGYTGWARPEFTLARFFVIDSVSTSQPTTSKTFSVDIYCHKHESCFKGSSTFYLRAYGPSVIPGIVENRQRGRFTFHFDFIDPGQYTVEAVLTYSDPPPIGDFPLGSGQKEPSFEGYLIPGFPLEVNVVDDGEAQEKQDGGLCKLDELLDTSLNAGATKGRWRVKQKSNSPNHVDKATKVTKSGYLRNFNSLGIHMDWEHAGGCSLLPPRVFEKSQGSKHPFVGCTKNIHIIFIGDSVLRVQKATFDEMVEGLPHIQTSYINLYGGFRRVQRLEPTFQTKLKEIPRQSPNTVNVILFNTGMHDIHRLCAESWHSDRYEYMDKELLDSGTFSCIKEYQALLQDFGTAIDEFPADLKVFQTTTAAWPKYGNFAIEWPLEAQSMPMTSEIVPYFNEVAFRVLKNFERSIQIMDGYWITYSRPDNREIGPIGNKLSHPGLEVQSAMSRIWAMLILHSVCTPI